MLTVLQDSSHMMQYTYMMYMYVYSSECCSSLHFGCVVRFVIYDYKSECLMFLRYNYHTHAVAGPQVPRDGHLLEHSQESLRGICSLQFPLLPAELSPV